MRGEGLRGRCLSIEIEVRHSLSLINGVYKDNDKGGVNESNMFTLTLRVVLNGGVASLLMLA